MRYFFTGILFSIVVTCRAGLINPDGPDFVPMVSTTYSLGLGKMAEKAVVAPGVLGDRFDLAQDPRNQVGGALLLPMGKLFSLGGGLTLAGSDTMVRWVKTLPSPEDIRFVEMDRAALLSVFANLHPGGSGNREPLLWGNNSNPAGWWWIPSLILGHSWNRTDFQSITDVSSSVSFRSSGNFDTRFIDVGLVLPVPRRWFLEARMSNHYKSGGGYNSAGGRVSFAGNGDRILYHLEVGRFFLPYRQGPFNADGSVGLLRVSLSHDWLRQDHQIPGTSQTLSFRLPVNSQLSLNLSYTLVQRHQPMLPGVVDLNGFPVIYSNTSYRMHFLTAGLRFWYRSPVNPSHDTKH